MVNNINVFYHFFIAPDVRGLFWNWWLDDQMKKIEDSKLKDYATINLNITMPRYWTTISDIPIMNNNATKQITFEQKIVEYIENRYPYINILSIRDTGLVNIYEGSTLSEIWNFSNEVETPQIILYMHNKGVMSVGNPNSKLWREVLDEAFIIKWNDRVNELFFKDVVGLKDKQCDETILSGNYFWTTSDYVKTLEEPFYIDRYQYEKWILSNKVARLHIIKNTEVDHYKTYFFKEEL